MHMKDLVMKRPQTDILHQHIIVTPAPHLLSVATIVANRGNHNYCKIIKTAPIFIVSVNTAHALKCPSYNSIQQHSYYK